MLKRGFSVAVFGKIQSGLTHHYAKIRGGVTNTSEYTAGGITRTVYWFRNDSKRMGDYTPLGTLLVNEQAKDDFSKDVVDYVFLHEVGHDQMGFIGRTLFWVIYLSSGLLLIAGVIASPSILLEAVKSAPSIVMIPVYIAVALGVSLGAVIPFTFVCWIDETLAELFAISKIGISQYRTVLEEVKEESEAGLLRKIRIRIQYPPEALIFWIARKRGLGDTESGDVTQAVAPREGVRIMITLNANSATMITASVGAEVVRTVPAIIDARAFVPVMVRILVTGSGPRELPCVAYASEESNLSPATRPC